MQQCLASSRLGGTVKFRMLTLCNCLLTLEGHNDNCRRSRLIPQLSGWRAAVTIIPWSCGICKPTVPSDCAGHTRAVSSVSFHPHGISSPVAVSDQTVDLDRDHITTLQGIRVRSVGRVRSTGRMLVSSSEDGNSSLDSCKGECLRVLTVERPYEGMNISGVTGLTDAQKETLGYWAQSNVS